MMLSLRALCIKSICEKTPDAITFVLELPLPGTLIQEIMSNYANYRWKFINEVAYTCVSESDCFYFNELFDYWNPKVRTSCRDVLLAAPDCSMTFLKIQDKYWLCVNYYRIVGFNMIVCKSCYDMLKTYSVYREKIISVRKNHFNVVIYSRDMVRQVYQNNEYWCQNCFQTVLFTIIKSEDHCNWDLFKMSGHDSDSDDEDVKRFIETYYSDLEMGDIVDDNSIVCE